MRTKAENPEAHLEGRPTDPLVAFYFALSHLKNLFRQGWLRVGIPESRCESVAEHSYGVAILAGVRAPTKRRRPASSNAMGKLARALPVDHVAETTPFARSTTAICRASGTLTNTRVPDFSS